MERGFSQIFNRGLKLMDPCMNPAENKYFRHYPPILFFRQILWKAKTEFF